MTVSVELPRMGESVTEGTIVRWLKAEGDWVEEDEPLVEISTDKIDTELPAPASGKLQKIVAQEEQTVEVGAEIAVIDDAAAKDGEGKPSKAKDDGGEEPKAEKPAKAEKAAEAAPAQAEPAGNGKKVDVGVLSPLVRKLARENDVDLTQVKGTGQGGRITKADVMAAMESRGAKPARTGTIRESAPPAATAASTYTVPSGPSEEVPFSRVRRAIAEHMSRSIDTAVHVTNVFEVDMTRIASLR